MVQNGFRLWRILGALCHVPSTYWSGKLVDHSIDPHSVHFDRKSDRLSFMDFGVTISRDKHPFFLEGYQDAERLKDAINARFSMGKHDELIVETGVFKAIIQTAEELFILNEIFVFGGYNFVYKQPVVVWDIGMNTGLSSLYFASKGNAVVGYEPFKKTYEQALRNLALNAETSKRIKCHNYGIGGSSRTVTVDYSCKYKGNVGIFGVPEWLKKRDPDITREEITLLDACEALDSIASEHAGKDIVAKIDCEGSEYEIIDSLYRGGKLANLKAVMMEWHRGRINEDPAELTEHLCKSGFTVFCLSPCDKIRGMIYGVRT